MVSGFGPAKWPLVNGQPYNDCMATKETRAVPARPRALPADVSTPLIVRLLEEPELPAIVRRLETAALTRLIAKIGLEDAGEWLALATPTQLEQVLDADAWFAERPGEPEQFQARRFALWLEVLAQAGADQALAKVVAMDETFLAMAFSKLMRVFDVDRLQAYFRAQDAGDTAEHDAFEKALEGLPQEEFEEYLVVARDETGWDAAVDLLAALHERHFDLFTRLMRRCARATAAAADDEGTYATLLSADEELFETAAAEREARREQEGYVAPQDAKSLLGVMRKAEIGAILAESTTDPVIDTYLHGLRGKPQAVPEPAARGAPRAGAMADRLAAALAADEAAARPKAKRMLPAAGAQSKLYATMAELRENNPDRYYTCKRELSFLANVVMAGETRAGRKLGPSEAAAQVLATCERGLEILTANDAAWRARLAGRDREIIRLFRLGSAR